MKNILICTFIMFVTGCVYVDHYVSTPVNYQEERYWAIRSVGTHFSPIEIESDDLTVLPPQVDSSIGVPTLIIHSESLDENTPKKLLYEVSKRYCEGRFAMFKQNNPEYFYQIERFYDGSWRVNGQCLK